jgi:hypothetical protein
MGLGHYYIAHNIREAKEEDLLALPMKVAKAVLRPSTSTDQLFSYKTKKHQYVWSTILITTRGISKNHTNTFIRKIIECGYRNVFCHPSPEGWNNLENAFSRSKM